jgi:hypothetical protein
MGPRAGLDDVPYRNTNSDPSTLGADRNCSSCVRHTRSEAIYRTENHTQFRAELAPRNKAVHIVTRVPDGWQEYQGSTPGWDKGVF